MQKSCDCTTNHRLLLILMLISLISIYKFSQRGIVWPGRNTLSAKIKQTKEGDSIYLMPGLYRETRMESLVKIKEGDDQ